MKKARLKIYYFTCSSDATIKDIFKKGDILTYDKKLKMYYRKETNSLSTYPEIFIEKNTDIFEIFEEPEPQEEVIEGWVCLNKDLKLYYFDRKKSPLTDVPARLILNPKPKKEYVRWVMKEFTENLKKDDCPIYRVIATKSDNEKYCYKIKITVEE